MISQNQIVRLIEAQEYRQLVDRILNNGRCRSSTACSVLRHPGAAQAAALGLALQRLSELTYRPTDAASHIPLKLLGLQGSDGIFRCDDDSPAEVQLAVTATAVRGLMTWLDQASASPAHPIVVDVRNAIDRGLHAIAIQATLATAREPHAIGWAIVLWQLGDVARFRERVSVSDLLSLLNENAAALLEDELCRYAHAVAA